MGGVIVVRLALIEIAHPEVEAVLVWMAAGFDSAHGPLADTTGLVAGLLQQLGDRQILGFERVGGVG